MMNRREKLRIVLLGYVVRGPTGGCAWQNFHFMEGLLRLGHDVLFLEDSDDYPSCYDPSRHVVDEDPTFGLEWGAKAFESLGMSDRWAYFDAHTNRWFGRRDAREFCRESDLVIDMGGVNPLREWVAGVPLRPLVDLDPVFTQVRHLKNPAARERAAEHTHFFTLAENIGSPLCTVPDDGFPWKRVRQPIVLDKWDIAPPIANAPYTTVMQWTSYPDVEWNGITYGTKSKSFPEYMDVPSRTRVPLELAIGSDSAPRKQLAEAGWRVVNPLVVAETIWDYHNYIRSSRGEVTVAKHGYVTTWSGWFSERSAAYLASGRPVVTQETGFSEWIDADAGLFGFKSPDELVESLERIESDYDHHSRAARAIAEEYFEAEAVVTDFLDNVMMSAEVAAK